jgi:hypothetical protein
VFAWRGEKLPLWDKDPWRLFSSFSYVAAGPLSDLLEKGRRRCG